MRKLGVLLLSVGMLLTGWIFGYMSGTGVVGDNVALSATQLPEPTRSPSRFEQMVIAKSEATPKPTPRPTVKPTPRPTTKPTRMPVLSKGDRGERVKLLQSYLDRLGYNVGAIDGIFGQQTMEAVKAYQKRNGYYESGQASTALMAEMGNRIAASAIPRLTPKPTARSSSSSRTSLSSTGGSTTYVWITKSGSCYHRTNNCGNTDSGAATQIPKSQAIQQGYSACWNCY